MNAADVRSLFAYTRWANAQVLDAVAALPPESFVRKIPSSFPSLRDTLVHVLSAEWIWLERWKGVSPKAMLDAASFPTPEALRARWREIERERDAFLADLPDDALARVVSYVNTKGETWKYPLGHMMQHVVNHSTYHRGQVTTMLRQLGATPPWTDLLVFEDEGGKP